MLFLDIESGVIKIANFVISHPKMLEKDFPNFSENQKILKYLIKKSTIQRIEINEYCNDIFIESVAITFNHGKIEKNSINFVMNSNIAESSISQIAITKKIQKNINNLGAIRGLSEINFQLNWGELKLIYDVKTSAFTLIMLYK